MPVVDPILRHDPYHGIFASFISGDGGRQLRRHPKSPGTLPDPRTGRALKIATVEESSTAICPSCAGRAEGGFISFEADLRMVYACPVCQQLVWLHGA
jgi:hypothetical protein